MARLQGAQAGWHDARVAVAAETAATYNALRSCEALVVQTEADAASRAETARVTELAAKAGLYAPASAALARASAAQGRSLLAGQQAQCEQLLKSLVALTALDEPRYAGNWPRARRGSRSRRTWRCKACRRWP